MKIFLCTTFVGEKKGGGAFSNVSALQFPGPFSHENQMFNDNILQIAQLHPPIFDILQLMMRKLHIPTHVSYAVGGHAPHLL